MKQADIDGRQRDGLSTDERKELVALRRENRVAADGKGDPGKSRGLLPQRQQLLEALNFEFIEAEKVNPVRKLWRILGVSASGFYGWRTRQERPALRTLANRVLAELRLGDDGHGGRWPKP